MIASRHAVEARLEEAESPRTIRAEACWLKCEARLPLHRIASHRIVGISDRKGAHNTWRDPRVSDERNLQVLEGRGKPEQRSFPL